jgi:purine-binding chemotaxis protein CheW
MPLPRVRTEEPDESQLQFVAFQAGTQNFAVPIGQVKEVLSDRSVTPMPQGPSLLEGVIESRGKVIAVLDLSKSLGIVRTASESARHILVMSAGKQTVAIRVDCVQSVFTIPTGNVDPPPVAGAPHVLAFARSDNQVYIVLDMERLLPSDEPLSPNQLAVS